MKKIGIILNENRSISDKEIYSINKDLIKFLNRYNLLVIEFVIDNVDFEKSKKIIDECDGIILPGGDKPNKNIYKIIKYLYISNKPTLGICLGMQELALFFDGKYNKLLTNKHKSNKEYVHEIIIADNSLLYKILGKKRIMVNIKTRQRIKKITKKIDKKETSKHKTRKAPENKNKDIDKTQRELRYLKNHKNYTKN